MPLWNITLLIARSKPGQPQRTDRFALEIDPVETVLDAVERVWAFHDRSLCYRHACHHSVCGACAMRVNGVEKLTCITPLSEVTRDGGTLRVEPLRNFPVVSDLVVDMGQFYRDMQAARYPQVTPLEREPVGLPPGEPGLARLNDCIECGCCVSACPVATTATAYLGPAALAGAQFAGLAQNPELLEWVDQANGPWRCHSAYECSAVCPSFVEPGARIMDLRRQIVTQRLRRVFRRTEEPA